MHAIARQLSGNLTTVVPSQQSRRLYTYIQQLFMLLFRYTHTFVGHFPAESVPESKTNLDFTEARDSEWKWHQLGHMQVCTLLQTDNHTSTPPLSFYRPFLPPNQQRQSAQGNGLLLR